MYSGRCPSKMRTNLCSYRIQIRLWKILQVKADDQIRHYKTENHRMLPEAFRRPMDHLKFSEIKSQRVLPAEKLFVLPL